MKIRGRRYKKEEEEKEAKVLTPFKLPLPNPLFIGTSSGSRRAYAYSASVVIKDGYIFVHPTNAFQWTLR